MKLYSETIPDKLGNYLMRVRLEEDDGTVTEKSVPMDVYLSILKDNTFSNSEELVHIPKLPKHYLDGKISSSEDTFSVSLFYPEEKRAMKFGNKHWYVPFPPLVFKFAVNKGVIASKQCVAVIGTGEDMPVYCYPFGNVSSESGSICMGSISGRNIRRMEDVEDVVADFFMSETNNDYYSDNNATSYRQEELLGRLEKMEHFPVEWLKDTGKTLSNII